MNVTSLQPSIYTNYSHAATDDYKKKFFLFCGHNHHPSGGWEDFKGDFSTIEDALYFLQREVEADERQWFQIVNIKTQNIVKEYPEERSQR